MIRSYIAFYSNLLLLLGYKIKILIFTASLNVISVTILTNLIFHPYMVNTKWIVLYNK